MVNLKGLDGVLKSRSESEHLLHPQALPLFPQAGLAHSADQSEKCPMAYLT